MQAKLLFFLSFSSLVFLTVTFAVFSFVPQVNATSTASVTITSSPSTGSGYVTVDGSDITTPAVFIWDVGDTHTIKANSTVEIVSGQSRYAYSNWSDNGTQTHTITVTSETTTFTANFNLQYYLSVSGGNGISYSNPQPENWYYDGSSTTVSTRWVYYSSRDTDYVSNSSGIVLRLPFDEVSGTTAYDYSVNNNDGSLTGASCIYDDYRQALNFNGNDAVSVSHAASISPISQITVSFWVKAPLQDGVFTYALNKGLDYYFTTYISTGNLRFCVTNSSSEAFVSPESQTTLDNEWHFLVGTYDGTKIRLFVDGEEEGNGTDASGSIRVTESPLFIGSYNQDGMFKGIIDDVHIFNRALSASEISTTYKNYFNRDRMAVTNWQLDGVNQNTTRQSSGTLTTPLISMSNYHAVSFSSTIQYPLTISGGFNVTLSQPSPTDDSFFDSESTLSVTTNYTWEEFDGNTRQNLLSYTLDNTTINVTRTDSGVFSSPTIIFNNPHYLTFTSIEQYLISFQALDNSGTVNINQSSLQIEIADKGLTTLPESKMWLDNGTQFKILAVIWENVDVTPNTTKLYTVTEPLNVSFLSKVYNLKLVITDYLGAPLSNTKVKFILVNGKTISSATDSDGIVNLNLVPLGQFRAVISSIGTITIVDGDVSTEPVKNVSIFASYLTFGLISGAIISVAFGFVLFRWYRNSSPFKGIIEGYVKVNWGAPFVVCFMILLFLATIFLSARTPLVADSVSVYAYYALVVGVVLQLVCFFKYKKRNREID